MEVTFTFVSSSLVTSPSRVSFVLLDRELKVSNLFTFLFRDTYGEEVQRCTF